MSRDPTLDPQPGDVLRSSFESIGERRVIGRRDGWVNYIVTRLGGKPRQMRCSLMQWHTWCRQNSPAIQTDALKAQFEIEGKGACT
jgi:hypothetical protein